MRTQLIAVLVGSGLAVVASSWLLQPQGLHAGPVQVPVNPPSSSADVAPAPRDAERQAIQHASKRPARPTIPEAVDIPPVPLLSAAPFRTLKGREGELEVRLISELNRTGFLPESREAHFQWVHANRGRITGWWVQSSEITTSDAGDLITLWIYPIHTSGATVVNDGVFETYRLTDDGAEFLSSRVDESPKITVY